ncbi:MAG TPA: hypothetical protein VFA89_20865 [Terriglobales bacterium]|nr:hypothetical protein [Terriglobales bacterium]
MALFGNTPSENVTDLTVEVFRLIRKTFWNDAGQSIACTLRIKGINQDDPLDEYIVKVAQENLPKNATAVRSLTRGKQNTGSLTCPDFVVYRPELCAGQSQAVLAIDLTRIVGIEVKKLDFVAGKQNRDKAMDFNSTPPCGTIRVYSNNDEPIDIRGFYLFVQQEALPNGQVRFPAMTLCDGNLLNKDRVLYLKTIGAVEGARKKEIGLGTFADGANRNRPMIVFPNPLSAEVLKGKFTLVHSSSELANAYPDLFRVGRITRTETTTPQPGTEKQTVLHEFHCYQSKRDTRAGVAPFDVHDPIKHPEGRTERVQGRGHFRIAIKPTD